MCLEQGYRRKPQVFPVTDNLLSNFKVSYDPLAKELLTLMQLCQLGPRYLKHLPSQLHLKDQNVIWDHAFTFWHFSLGLPFKIKCIHLVIFYRKIVLSHIPKSWIWKCWCPQGISELALSQTVNKTLVRGNIEWVAWYLTINRSFICWELCSLQTAKEWYKS